MSTSPNFHMKPTLQNNNSYWMSVFNNIGRVI